MVRAIKNLYLLIDKGSIAFKNKLTEIIKFDSFRIQLNYQDLLQNVAAYILLYDIN